VLSRIPTGDGNGDDIAKAPEVIRPDLTAPVSARMAGSPEKKLPWIKTPLIESAALSRAAGW